MSNPINEYCEGRMIKEVDLVLVDGGSYTKVTFIGTDNWLIVRPNGVGKVALELHSPDVVK